MVVVSLEILLGRVEMFLYCKKIIYDISNLEICHLKFYCGLALIMRGQKVLKMFSSSVISYKAGKGCTPNCDSIH